MRKPFEYVIASCKGWHKDGFEKLADEYADKAIFHYAETSTELRNIVATRKPRYIFFLHWSWIVPREIWASFESVCFHMTDLPYGRGGSPLQNLIACGHDETMLTAFMMNDVVDGGPIYVKRPLSLAGRAEDIYRRAGRISYEVVRWIIETEPEPVPQTGEVTRFERRTPNESEIPEAVDLKALYNHIRMLDAPSYPLAFLCHGDFKFEFHDAYERPDGTISAKVTISKVD